MDDYMPPMCRRVIQSGGPVRYAIVDGMNVHDSRAHNIRRGGTRPPANSC
jgi:hypothetical protein